MFKMGLLALRNEGKFLLHIKSEWWLSEMKIVWDSLLHIIVIDNELMENLENDNIVLQSLMEIF